MINAVSAYTPYSTYGLYGASVLSRAAQAQSPDKLQGAQRSGLVTTAQKIHQPDTPVQPVTPVRAISEQEDPAQAGLLRFNSDPAEMAVRMRIQYPGDAQSANAAQQGQAAQGAEQAKAPGGLPGAEETAAQPARNPALGEVKIAGLKGEEETDPASGEAKSAQEVMDEAECQTCKDRKYQDGSDDPGVSFKTPTSVAPEQAASAVRGHENEHVVREQAKASREDRKVVSQSVTYHTDICPECGKVYVSGGETRTVTKANTDNQAEEQNQEQEKEKDQKNPLAPAAAA